MGLFGLIAKSSRQAHDRSDLVALYRRLRPLRLRLNNKLVTRFATEVLKRGAKRLGMMQGSTFVFDTEDQASVLMDYCVYDVRRNGLNAVDQYLCDCPPEPDSDETIILRSMQHATYTLVAVQEIEPGVGCQIVDLYTEQSLLMLDIGLSKTAEPGLVVATRLLDFGDFVTTGGAPLPVGVLGDEELESWQRKLRAGRHEDNFDPAPLIRACLHRGGSERVAYADAGANPQDPWQPIGLNSAPRESRRPALNRRRAIKDLSKRRCDCGSGKMYKNCCGRS